MTVALVLGDLGLDERTVSELSVEHAVRIGATVDAPEVPREGEPLPLLWHWAYFTPTVPTSGLGEDGHAPLPQGPASGYPRRMWASGTVEARAPLVLGRPATRTSTITSAKESVGRSGPLLIVQLEHRYSQGGRDAVVEGQTLVYREAGPPTPPPVGDHRPPVGEDEWHQRHVPDSRLLFRFSAVTFNTHRIHYDQPYATGVEGYPGLVVHGPLTALLVGESIRREHGRELARFEFRANAPLFADHPFTIVGRRGDPVTARVVRNDGTDAVQVTAKLAG
jgi:hydroxyacyl-ACP dehydratase HTD2-like protein with hotdog domain